MRYPSTEEILIFLESLDLPRRTIDHMRCASRIACRIADHAVRVGHQPDCLLIKCGAMLHDCGLAKSQKVDHINYSRKMIESSTLGDAEFRETAGILVERHLGPGLAADDVVRINEQEGIQIPVKDYLPISLEEKIVCYADKLCLFDREITFEERWEIQLADHGAESPFTARMMQLHNEMHPFWSEPEAGEIDSTGAGQQTRL